MEEETVTIVFGQIRIVPPRASLNVAGLAPAATWDPLITCIPLPTIVTDPCTDASEEYTSPTGACACALSVANGMSREAAKMGSTRRIGRSIEPQMAVEDTTTFLQRYTVKIKGTSYRYLCVVFSEEFVFLDLRRYRCPPFKRCVVHAYNFAATTNAYRLRHRDLRRQRQGELDSRTLLNDGRVQEKTNPARTHITR
jgi:hypothetical protein